MITGKQKKNLQVIGFIGEKETIIATVPDFGTVKDLLSSEQVAKYDRFVIVEVSKK